MIARSAKNASQPVTSRPDRASFLLEARGAAAIEFGMIAAPFFLIIFAIFDYSYGNYLQAQLESVTRLTARDILTGSVQNQTVKGQPLDATAFRKNVLCPKLPAIMTCDAVFVDVQAFNPPSDGPIPTSTPYENFINDAESGVTPPSFDNKANAYCVGGAGKYVVLRVAYPAPILTTSLLYPEATSYNGRLVRLLTATATFRNEPFPTSNVTC